MFLKRNYLFLKWVKTSGKSLILSFSLLLVTFLFNFTICAQSAQIFYVYKNSHGNILFTNIKPLKVTKNYKRTRVIRIKSSYNHTKVSNNINYKNSTIDNLLKKAAQDYNIDYNLLKAVAVTESNLQHSAVSHKGAIGVMQLMPETARRFGVKNLNSIEENIRGGAKYLKFLLKKFDYKPALALAAYNAGENSVVKYNGVPPYPETIKYLDKVLTLYRKLIKNERFF